MAEVSDYLSEIILMCWFDAQKTFLIINVENSLILLNIFVKTAIQFLYLNTDKFFDEY